MKNRASILCLLNDIKTADEYAYRIGVSVDEAIAILRKKAILTEEVITRNCKVFNCTRAYFLELE